MSACFQSDSVVTRHHQTTSQQSAATAASASSSPSSAHAMPSSVSRPTSLFPGLAFSTFAVWVLHFPVPQFLFLLFSVCPVVTYSDCLKDISLHYNSRRRNRRTSHLLHKTQLTLQSQHPFTRPPSCKQGRCLPADQSHNRIPADKSAGFQTCSPILFVGRQKSAEKSRPIFQ